MFCDSRFIYLLTEITHTQWAGHLTRTEELKNAYSNLVGKYEGKRPLGRPRRRWEDNIRMALWESGWEDVD
jgi:hypothetical protein